MIKSDIDRVMKKLSLIILDDVAFEGHTVTKVKLFLGDVEQVLKKRFTENTTVEPKP